MDVTNINLNAYRHSGYKGKFGLRNLGYFYRYQRHSSTTPVKLLTVQELEKRALASVTPVVVPGIRIEKRVISIWLPVFMLNPKNVSLCYPKIEFKELVIPFPTISWGQFRSVLYVFLCLCLSVITYFASMGIIKYVDFQTQYRTNAEMYLQQEVVPIKSQMDSLNDRLTNLEAGLEANALVNIKRKPKPVIYEVLGRGNKKEHVIIKNGEIKKLWEKPNE